MKSGNLSTVTILNVVRYVSALHAMPLAKTWSRHRCLALAPIPSLLPNLAYAPSWLFATPDQRHIHTHTTFHARAHRFRAIPVHSRIELILVRLDLMITHNLAISLDITRIAPVPSVGRHSKDQLLLKCQIWCVGAAFLGAYQMRHVLNCCLECRVSSSSFLRTRSGPNNYQQCCRKPRVHCKTSAGGQCGACRRALGACVGTLGACGDTCAS